ncbi:MAG TPA: M43 family zinc metalloprotease [Chitinophagaceae bacterium]|nr:M43 family zinc metalloprotease [Chitinophagaceae bacterium]
MAQRACGSHDYQQHQLRSDPSWRDRMNAMEELMREGQSLRGTQSLIRIPVVVHILYHYPSQKIPDSRVHEQIAALNRDFRRRATDTSRTPAYFRQFAADCEIEFQLATSDPRMRSTTGIVKKYSPVLQWGMDDRMKFSSEMGSDAWDPGSYLNIWVCDLKGLAGYSSMPGGPKEKDGIVMDFEAFGTTGVTAGYDMGRTLVHEVGHWLGLKHLWGDTDCGDDGVSDTPQQSFYTVGCPSGIRVTCNNGPYGNMYMNFMDFTADACMNLFTVGQKQRMRSLFSAGGPRASLLHSRGLNPPLIAEAPLPDEDPRWLQPRLYPNPANEEIFLDLSYDPRWIGKPVTIANLSGQVQVQIVLSGKIQRISVKNLPAGIYMLNAQKEDGAVIQFRVVKL